MREATATLRRERLAARGTLAVALLVTALVHAAIVTEGFRVSLFQPDTRHQYFDAYADSLRDGRLDVHPYHVDAEAFVIGDRTYAYFGLTPALLRLPLHAAFPSLWGRWQRLSLLLCGLLTVAATHALLRLARGAATAPTALSGWLLHGAFLLTVGLGSTSVFMPSRANVFHEANAFGAALGLLGYVALIRYLGAPSFGRAAGVILLCAACVQARLVPGLGLLGATGLVGAAQLLRSAPGSAWARRPADYLGVSAARRGAACAGVLLLGVALAAASFVGVNHAKSGAWLTLPWAAHVQYSEQRLAKTSGRAFGLEYAVHNAYYYWSPTAIGLRLRPPRLLPVLPQPLPYLPGGWWDWKEPVVGLAIASPGLVGLAGLGLLLLWVPSRRRPELPITSRACVLGSAAAALAPLFYFSITPRYAHDMLPFLVLSGAGAVAALIAGEAARRRRALALLAIAGVWSAAVWIPFAFDYQEWTRSIRVGPYASPKLLAVYQKALERDPDQALLHAQLGQLQLELGQRREGLAHLERALALDPDDAEALLFLGRALLESDPRRAVGYLERAVAADPQQPVAHHLLGLALERIGRREQARAQLRAALERYPSNAPVRQELEARLGAGRAGAP